jgi:hypothetical protein
MAKLSVQSYFETSVPIDGVEITVHVTRLAASDFFTWARDFDRVSDPVSERQLTIRLTDEERAKRPVQRPRTAAEAAAADACVGLRELLKGTGEDTERELLVHLTTIEAALPAEPDSDDEVHVLPDAEIRQRRLAEMTPEARARWDAQDQADEAFARTFIADTLTRFIALPAGEIDGPDGPITTGEGVLRYFGGHTGALQALVRAVRDENVLPTALKNAWRSARASMPSSSTPDRDQPGPAPAKTAEPAA